MFTLEAIIYLCAITPTVSEGSQLKYRFCVVASGMTNLLLKNKKGLLVSLCQYFSCTLSNVQWSVHFQTVYWIQGRFER